MPRKYTSKKANKAARATTTTTTTTVNDNGSNIDSAEQTNAGEIFALMRKRSQGIDNSDADLSSKRPCLNTVQAERYPVLDAEGKLNTPGKIRRKILRYISSQKLKRKKTDDQTAETNRVGCLSQRRVQTRNKIALALETNREYFVKTYGEGLDDFLHADYMSDLETDCEVADNSSSADRVFGRFRPSWRSEKGDNFVEELDAIYQNIPKGSQTCSFDRKILGRREKKLTDAKMKKLPSWAKN